ncbi:MAG: ZIP family metal transporter [Coriobacteriales bacterium]|jgi:ZIP family zinc transporter|nr:ZIP family metal transporter [Coriobacteriales bacterium]
MSDALLIALGLGFAFLMTTLGSATVLLFRGDLKGSTQTVFLGFAAGIMIAASVWSLIIPSIELSEEAGRVGWIPAVGGIIIGAAFLFLLDHLIPHFHPASGEMEGPRSNFKRSTLLVSAITLHNIPEGMAVGLALAMAVQSGGNPALIASAFALALGIGIQNFPEGAAVALPLRQAGLSAPRAFLVGVGSGAVEPLFGMLAVLLASLIAPFMPWLLAFAAGAMLYVVVEELIPEAQLSSVKHLGTISVLAGFLLMMTLDVALG